MKWNKWKVGGEEKKEREKEEERKDKREGQRKRRKKEGEGGEGRRRRRKEKKWFSKKKFLFLTNQNFWCWSYLSLSEFPTFLGRVAPPSSSSCTRANRQAEADTITTATAAVMATRISSSPMFCFSRQIGFQSHHSMTSWFSAPRSVSNLIVVWRHNGLCVTSSSAVWQVLSSFAFLPSILFFFLPILFFLNPSHPLMDYVTSLVQGRVTGSIAFFSPFVASTPTRTADTRWKLCFGNLSFGGEKPPLL